jgi:hypothetical protein
MIAAGISTVVILLAASVEGFSLSMKSVLIVQNKGGGHGELGEFKVAKKMMRFLRLEDASWLLTHFTFL